MLASVSVENFRCIHSATLTLDPRATAISGPNASGKTSFLEALFFLAHGRSFRSSLRSELIAKGTSFFRVVARQADGLSKSAMMGVEFDGAASTFRLAGESVSASLTAAAFPVQIIDPSIHRILEEGSSRRRRLMDWGVFHVEPQFLSAWRRYQRALAQRNAALHAGAVGPKLEIWSSTLVESSIQVNELRKRYIAELAPLFAAIGSELLGDQVEVSYRRGWSAEETLDEALRHSRPRELKQRTTVVGPHRADLEIRMSGGLAKRRVSRGQQKLLASALVLAQIELRAESQTSPVCLLLDDPAAELDAHNLAKLLHVVGRLPAQIVVTSLEPQQFPGMAIGQAFHVEQGRFSQVI